MGGRLRGDLRGGVDSPTTQQASAITARLGIEAGVRQGWDRFVGPQGDVVCIDRFGASAPGDVVMRELGFNVDNVISHAKALL